MSSNLLICKRLLLGAFLFSALANAENNKNVAVASAHPLATLAVVEPYSSGIGGGGIWSQKDLDEYQIIERAPLVGHYNDMEIVSVGPPSSGGTTIISILNMLQNFKNRKFAPIRTQALYYRSNAQSIPR